MQDEFYSTQEAVSDGTLTQLMVTIDYIRREDVYVFFDGVEYPDRWAWASPAIDTIIFHEPVPAGQTVLVRRLTQMDHVPHIFGDGSGAVGNSRFNYLTVDENFDFFKRATQDSMDSYRLTGSAAEQAEFWARAAELSASQSEGYRNSASASAAAANVSANNAGNSATAAAGSATAASNSANQASASAAASQNSAQAAKGSETLVETYKNQAQAAASNAATSESNARSSATTASTQASNASGSASSAATSASNASSSATSASNSATAAQAARTGAESANTAAQAAKTSAQASEVKAKAWATNPEDVPVEPNEFSAYHWAQKAKDFVDGDAYLKVANNLSDLTNVTSAGANLGLKGSAYLEHSNLDNETRRDRTVGPGWLSLGVVNGTVQTIGSFGARDRPSGHRSQYGINTIGRPSFSGNYGLVVTKATNGVPLEGNRWYVEEAYGTNGSHGFRMWVNTEWRFWAEYLHTENTVVDSNGFVKRASPIVNLYDNRIDSNLRKEVSNASFSKLDVGVYRIDGVPPLSRDGWYIESPKDRNNNIYFTLDYEEGDGFLIIKTYTPDYSKGFASNGVPVDILEGRFISLRFEENPGLYPGT